MPHADGLGRLQCAASSPAWLIPVWFQPGRIPNPARVAFVSDDCGFLTSSLENYIQKPGRTWIIDRGCKKRERGVGDDERKKKGISDFTAVYVVRKIIRIESS